MLNGVSVVDVLMNNAFDDIVVVLSSAEEVADFKPQFHKIKEGPGRAVIITARAPDGTGFDFYSRVFGPKIGVDEDPVCGSAHCALALYWHEKLGKCDFVVYQIQAVLLRWVVKNDRKPQQLEAVTQEAMSPRTISFAQVMQLTSLMLVAKLETVTRC
ncbi:uncharacterized isomerase BH0283 [Helianthus annuus]|uniref:uncharacterized isomerase BH0283 n=1 Tax=Helianthus annuus TaxID=4232 RepID=UPI000B8F6059|nr:uncharacterized isomerase BH0283 [Helianthus annuus]